MRVIKHLNQERFKYSVGIDRDGVEDVYKAYILVPEAEYKSLHSDDSVSFVEVIDSIKMDGVKVVLSCEDSFDSGDFDFYYCKDFKREQMLEELDDICGGGYKIRISAVLRSYGL